MCIRKHHYRYLKRDELVWVQEYTKKMNVAPWNGQNTVHRCRHINNKSIRSDQIDYSLHYAEVEMERWYYFFSVFYLYCIYMSYMTRFSVSFVSKENSKSFLSVKGVFGLPSTRPISVPILNCKLARLTSHRFNDLGKASKTQVVKFVHLTE